MKRTALQSLRDYLNARTLPGGAYQVGPGIAWSVVLPRQNYAEDLKATLGDARVRTLVGVIMPSGSQKVHASRGGYDADQTRAGAVREMDVSLTIFARSLKAYAYEGELLEIEDLLEELIGDFSDKDSGNAVLAASLGSLTLAVIPPDFTVFEFQATVRYKTASHREAPLGTVGGLEPVTGPVLIPGGPLTQNPDGTYTGPGGVVIIPNPDGSVTLPGGTGPGQGGLPPGTTLPPGSDGGVTLPGTVLTPGPGGAITLPDGTVILPNPDGSYTLPDGTVVWPNPDGTVTIPGGVIIVTPGQPPRTGERRSGLLHFILRTQEAP